MTSGVTMTPVAITLHIRSNKVSKMAFNKWLTQYQEESGNVTATQGEAFDELLRRVGVLPPLRSSAGVPGQVLK